METAILKNWGDHQDQWQRPGAANYRRITTIKRHPGGSGAGTNTPVRQRTITIARGPTVHTKVASLTSVPPSDDNNSTSTLSTDKSDITPYQRVIQNLTSNDKWLKEITLGTRLGFYRFQKDLGRGNFSTVKSAMHSLTKEKVAVKIIDKSKLQSKTRRLLNREIGCMEALRHPNIIQLFQVMETPTKLYLALEYAEGGELFYRISSEGRLQEIEAKDVFSQITAAVCYMHKNNIIHRDLKAENVFIASHKVVKLGDFGFSIRIQAEHDPLTTFCGSPPYAAPELFRDDCYMGKSVDVWSLGVLLYLMVTATLPFKGPTVAAVKKQILTGHYTLPSYLSPSCQALIGTILQQDPKQRYTMDQIKAAEWLRGHSFPEGHNRGVSNRAERDVRKQLNKLGLTDEMLRKAAERGPRSDVTGTYRILLHRLQNSLVSECSCRAKDKGMCPGQKGGMNHVHKSKTCTIL